MHRSCPPPVDRRKFPARVYDVDRCGRHPDPRRSGPASRGATTGRSSGWRCPAFGALVAEPLFLLADSAIVGHLGTPQLAGLGVAGALLATAVSVCVFLAYGTTAAVARRVGAGDLRAAIAQGVDGIWLALGLGVPAGRGRWRRPPGRWSDAFGTSAAATPYALTYLRVSVARPAGDARRARRHRRAARPAGHPAPRWSSPPSAPSRTSSSTSCWSTASGLGIAGLGARHGARAGRHGRGVRWSSWSAAPAARARRCGPTCPASGPRAAPASRSSCGP